MVAPRPTPIVQTDQGYRQTQVVELAAAERSSRQLLRAMLKAGQHFWTFPDALMIAGCIGLPQVDVRAGLGQ